VGVVCERGVWWGRTTKLEGEENVEKSTENSRLEIYCADYYYSSTQYAGFKGKQGQLLLLIKYN